MHISIYVLHKCKQWGEKTKILSSPPTHLKIGTLTCNKLYRHPFWQIQLQCCCETGSDFSPRSDGSAAAAGADLQPARYSDEEEVTICRAINTEEVGGAPSRGKKKKKNKPSFTN